MLSLISGTVTLAGCLVGSRWMPIGSGAIDCFQVNESTVDTRSHGKLPISTRKFEHSHAFCFVPYLPWMLSPPPFAQRTCSGSNSTSRYSASLLDASSLGNVMLVISAFMNVSVDCAL